MQRSLNTAKTFLFPFEIATIATLLLVTGVMSMKIMTSQEAQNSFGDFLDTAQHEPVMVTRRNRPVGVMLSMENIPAIFELADSMRDMIKAGVKAGLADAKSDRGQELTDGYIADLKTELQSRIKFNNSK